VSSRLIPAAENWHPLDGVPAPEYIPPYWDGPHVGRRLIEAFRTLDRTPMRGMSAFGSTWPAYRQEFREYYAALVGDERAEHATIAAERNRVRVMPSAIEITRMELVIGWPARYLGDQPQLAIIVGTVARLRALDWPMENIARKLRYGPSTARRHNRHGLDIIARGLRLEPVIVF
jgi:hypothetical protein